MLGRMGFLLQLCTPHSFGLAFVQSPLLYSLALLQMLFSDLFIVMLLLLWLKVRVGLLPSDGLSLL